VAVLAVGADEGYGPTWDSDDEYDNFIRKMNPPRCTLNYSPHPAESPSTAITNLLVQHCLLKKRKRKERWQVHVSSLTLVSFGD